MLVRVRVPLVVLFSFYMNKQEILNTLKSLGKSQGYYARMYQQLSTDTPDILDIMENKNFKDAVDMILWLES